MSMKRKVLVVEDNALNRKMLVDILHTSYNVTEAENGKEALDILNKDDSFSIILLDMMMPVMDGYTFLDRLHESKVLSSIPVIVMTQNDTDEDEINSLIHGAMDFIPKPYKPQIILHKISTIIRFRETSAMMNELKFDALTGLYTKNYLFSQIRKTLNENPDGEYAIVVTNFENFKLFNDIYGVKKGDEVLAKFGHDARSSLQDSDLAGRYASDRFVFMTDKKKSEKILNSITNDAKIMSHSMGEGVSIRIGIYEIHDTSIEVEQMVDRAFLAADSIKGHYNDLVADYDDQLRSQLLYEQTLTSTMAEGIDKEQFLVYLQPKYDIATNRLAGAEALVRWDHPIYGLIYPGSFIPMFEQNGFITTLDNYIWEKTCQIISKWKKEGYPLFPVSVNVSRADIYHPDLCEKLVDLIHEYGIEPEELHLEVTESAYTENPDQLLKAVEKLHSEGFIIEMDDFGSGYSSLNMLNQMKIDILKLDMKFIQNETSKPNEKSILNFVVNLAKWMKLNVVAEGVETDIQLEKLRAIGCDYAQGFLFAKPMPEKQYCELLEKYKK